jgi:hypothetical protein
MAINQSSHVKEAAVQSSPLCIYKPEQQPLANRSKNRAAENRGQEEGETYMQAKEQGD